MKKTAAVKVIFLLLWVMIPISCILARGASSNIINSLVLGVAGCLFILPPLFYSILFGKKYDCLLIFLFLLAGAGVMMLILPLAASLNHISGLEGLGQAMLMLTIFPVSLYTIFITASFCCRFSKFYLRAGIPCMIFTIYALISFLMILFTPANVPGGFFVASMLPLLLFLPFLILMSIRIIRCRNLKNKSSNSDVS